MATGLEHLMWQMARREQRRRRIIRWAVGLPLAFALLYVAVRVARFAWSGQ